MPVKKMLKIPRASANQQVSVPHVVVLFEVSFAYSKLFRLLILTPEAQIAH